MQGSDLKYLVGVSDVARLDQDAAALTITCDGEHMTSIYVGNYSGGWREVDSTGVKPFTIALAAAKTKQLVGLFKDDEPVQVTHKEQQLTIVGKSSRLNLQEWSQPRDIEEVGRNFSRKDIDAAIMLPGQQLLSEMEVASQYASDTTLNQVLMGVRFQSSENGIVLTAFDGFGMLFQSTLEARVDRQMDIVIPAKDLVLGLKLVATPNQMVLVKLADSDVVAMYDREAPTATFRCSALAGKWPKTEDVVGMPIYGSTHKLSPESIRTLATAGRAFECKDITLQPQGDYSVFKIDAEGGGYVVRIDGKVTEPMIYDMDSLSKLSQIGSEIEITVPSTPDLPTIAKAGNRRCWLVARR